MPEMLVDRPTTGHLARAYPKIHRRTVKYLSGRGILHYKIGITNAPKRRLFQYGANMDTMFVLYRTTALNYVQNAEKELVDDHLYQPKCLNERRGGGGAYGEPPYYLYLVVKYR